MAQREYANRSGKKPEDNLNSSSNLSRRDFLKIAGTSLIFLGISSCAPSVVPTTLPETGASPEPEKGTGWLIYGANQEGEGIDPAVGYTLWSRWVDDNIYDSLFRFRGDPPELVNHLAKSYEVSDDGIEWTFELEEGVKFHDGGDLRASDVVYTIQRMMAMGDAPSFLWERVDPERCEALGDYTVKFVLKEPFGPFLFTLPWLYIVNENLLKENEADGDWGAAYLRDHDAGSGPFMITRFEPSVNIEMPHFPDYWKGWPENHLDGWSYEIHREMATIKQLLQTHDVQITDRLSEDDFLTVDTYEGVVVEENTTSNPLQIKMNNGKWPTDNLDFRKAVTYAFDYDGVINGLLKGHATPLDSPLPPSLPGHVSLLNSKRDLDLARQHLELSGFDPNELTLSFGYVADDPFQRDVGLLLQSNLGELGIQVELQAYTPALSVAQWESADVMNHFWPIWAVADYPDPEVLLYPQYHSGNWGNWYSCSFYKNERYDQLMDEARSLVDLEDRIPIYEELQRILVEDAADVWLFAWHWRVAMVDCVKGYEWMPAGASSTYLYPMRIEGPC